MPSSWRRLTDRRPLAPEFPCESFPLLSTGFKQASHAGVCSVVPSKGCHRGVRQCETCAPSHPCCTFSMYYFGCLSANKGHSYVRRCQARKNEPTGVLNLSSNNSIHNTSWKTIFGLLPVLGNGLSDPPKSRFARGKVIGHCCPELTNLRMVVELLLLLIVIDVAFVG